MELANFIEKGGKKIAELQASAAEVQEMQNSIRDVISKAEFYFANKNKGGDSMFVAKLAAAKQTIEKFNLAKIEELTPLKERYSDNIKNLAEFNAKMKETQKKQGELLHLQETYQAISAGNYLSKEKEQQEKEQDKSKK